MLIVGLGVVVFLLSFVVPSTTARVSCMVPIVMGIIIAFGVPLRSRFAGMLMIAVAQADSLWNVGIKTAAAQNMVAVSFIEKQLGVNVSWLDWFIAAAPFSAIMSVVLYFILMKMMPPEKQEIEGGRRNELAHQLVSDNGEPLPLLDRASHVITINEPNMLAMMAGFGTGGEQITLPDDIMAGAGRCIRRMVELGG